MLCGSLLKYEGSSLSNTEFSEDVVSCGSLLKYEGSSLSNTEFSEEVDF